MWMLHSLNFRWQRAGFVDGDAKLMRNKCFDRLQRANLNRSVHGHRHRDSGAFVRSLLHDHVAALLSHRQKSLFLHDVDYLLA